MGRRAFLATCGILGSALVGAAASAAGPALDYAASPGRIVQEVHQRGAAPVAAELWGRKAVWEDVVGKVESAAPEWLRAAAALRPGARPDAAAELTDAVRLALMIDAKAVLANAIPAFSVDDVCSAGKDAPSSSVRSEEILIRQIRAVEGVHGAGLAGVRRRCLEHLHAGAKPAEAPSP